MSEHQLQRGPAGIGHNEPPPDPFLAKLEEDHAKLLAEQADLEISASKLPREVKSDEDVAAITAWVVKARDLARRTDKEREVAKRPILEMGRTLDGFFGGVRDALKRRADNIEQRSASYLKAKRIREEAEAKARADEARRIREEQEARAREAEARAAEAKRRADEEAERLRIAAANQAARDESARLMAEDDGVDYCDDTSAGEDADAAEEAARQAEVEAAAAAEEAAAAAKVAENAAKSALKSEKAADQGHRLSRTSGGGGAATVNTVWQARIDSLDALNASLGPLAPFLSAAAVDDAVKRSARADPRPTIPGVTYYETEEVTTRATRA